MDEFVLKTGQGGFNGEGYFGCIPAFRTGDIPNSRSGEAAGISGNCITKLVSHVVIN
ncbi:MAG: hypothetical protein ABI416_14605 [Ginsengibacter sp.]